MLLYIIRHAWAGHYGDAQWPDDFQRPLTPDGRQRFGRVVEILTQRGFKPELIATSPLVRCRETAEIVSRGVLGRPEVVERDELMPGHDKSPLVDWTNEQVERFDEIAWVGHAPDVGRAVSMLAGDAGSWVRFAKGAVAAVRFDAEVAQGQGELRWLSTAKLLGV